MNPIDKKKCADLIRETCDRIEKLRPDKEVKKKVNSLRKDAETLWPKHRNPLAEMQYEELQKGLHWNGTPDELEDGLVKMKARNEKAGKVEIAY